MNDKPKWEENKSVGFRVQVDGFKVVVAASLQNILYLRRSRHYNF